MYDTVHMWLDANLVSEIDLLGEITAHFEVTNCGQSMQTNISYASGYLKNIKVFINDFRVSLKGSLSKFYFDDPLKLMNRQETKEAIEKLSDCLHLPMHLAKVSRLDVTRDLEMKYPAENYYKCLGTAQYYNRLRQAKSLSYVNGIRQVFFYNKIAELKAKKIEIPQEQRGKNIMRLELRFMKHVSKQLKTEVYAHTLYDEVFYQKMLDRWYTEYTNIYKIKTPKPKLEDIKSVTDFVEYSALMYWKEQLGGQINTLNLIDQLKALEAFDKPEYYSRLKNKIKKVSEKYSKNTTDPLLEELNAMVEKAYLK